MIFPSFLTTGDTVAITCPSGFIAKEKVLVAQKVLEDWGFRVLLGETVGSEYHYFSASDEVRRNDLQRFLDDKNVKAILMGRGGYGLSRIIDELNFSQLKNYPKWICGFSDITVLHSHIHQNIGMATLHSPMCGAFKNEVAQPDHILSLLKTLKGEQIIYPVANHPLNKKGTVTAPLVGGNLAMLAHLTGSKSQIDTDGKILFIEDISEYLYNIDRMLYNLKRAGTLNNIAGLVCGGFTDLEDTERPFGQDIYHIILDKVKEINIPVCFDFPSGHDEINYTMVLGSTYTLNANDTETTLSINSQYI